MARKGERYVDGRCLILVERHRDIEARDAAKAHAERLRKAGQFVRVFKVNPFSYDVFAL